VASFLARARAGADPGDKAIAGYALMAAVWILVRPHDLLPEWPLYLGGHLLVLGAVAVTAATCRYQDRGLRRLWRSWDVFAYIVFLFLMSGKIGHALNPRDWDPAIIAVERATGGLRLLQWVQTWATRPLDELGKILWVSYYFLALLPGIPLYRRADGAAFREAKLAFVVGYLLSFLGYLFMPALGPLHFKDALGLVDPTTGVFVAGTLKKVVTALHGTTARYAFPSGHALTTAVVIWALVRHRVTPLAWGAVPWCAGVILSTLYLRYHYLSDVVVGLALSVVACAVAVRWSRADASRQPKP
jgi:membrane-associated phospholipid phosphatase